MSDDIRTERPAGERGSCSPASSGATVGAVGFKQSRWLDGVILERAFGAGDLTRPDDVAPPKYNKTRRATLAGRPFQTLLEISGLLDRG